MRGGAAGSRASSCPHAQERPGVVVVRSHEALGELGGASEAIEVSQGARLAWRR